MLRRKENVMSEDSNRGWTTGRPWRVEGLSDGQVPEPRLTRGAVLVQVAAWALNPVDYRLAKTLPIPLVGRRLLGSDFSGTVLSVGGGVTHVSEGDKVFGMLSALRGGVSADRIVIPGHSVARAPESVDLARAASRMLLFSLGQCQTPPINLAVPSCHCGNPSPTQT